MPRIHLPSTSLFPALAAAAIAAASLAQSPSGLLDTSLNGGLPVVTQLTTSGVNAPARGVVAGNGKVLVVGRSQAVNGAMGWLVMRYQADGTFDTTFSGDGRVELFQNTTSSRGAHDVAIDAQGRIVVVGGVYIVTSQSTTSEFAVVRLLTDGSLDGSFGSGGVVRVSFGRNRMDYASAVALQPDGRIVVGGTGSSASGMSLLLARVTASGQLDGTFGKSGKTTPLVVSNILRQHMMLQPGCMALDGAGRILVGGAGTSTSEVWGIARYTAAGKLDNSFGSGGVVTEALGNCYLNDLAVTTAGQIVASGTFGSGGRTETAVVRYTANGSRDTTFGSSGLASTIGSMPAALEYRGSACRVQQDGSVVIGGYTLDAFGVRYMAPFRFTAGGAADASFGPYGTGLGQVADGLPGSLFQGYAIAFDDVGRLVIGGGDNPGTNPSLAWMRWL